MPRRELKICQETLSPFLVTELKSAAEEFNRKNRERYTESFPKNPDRWESHYHFMPRDVTFTITGEVDKGMSWLAGSLFDFSFIRSIVASYYSQEGGHCFDPATLFFLILACYLDGHGDYAAFCRALLQGEKGKSYRAITGIDGSVPGEDDLCNFRKRVGEGTINAVMDMFVEFFMDFGLITPELVTADGQLEPSNSRYKGCAHFCDKCQKICKRAQAGCYPIQAALLSFGAKYISHSPFRLIVLSAHMASAPSLFQNMPSFFIRLATSKSHAFSPL